jgi:hypothetical protein
MVGPGTVSQRAERTGIQTRSVALVLCSDVMTGRGIDQILPHPGRTCSIRAYARNCQIGCL